MDPTRTRRPVRPLGNRARPRPPEPPDPSREALEDATEPTRLEVFVYGTLKRGQRNHECFCRGLVMAREATVRGRLYDLPYGYPALAVPEEDIRATGTTDYRADAEKGRIAENGPQETLSGWGTVYGEIFGFDDSEERLPALDGLEGFYPGEESFYRRVLIPATLTQTGTVLLAWAYAIKSESGAYLPGGRWPTP